MEEIHKDTGSRIGHTDSGKLMHKKVFQYLGDGTAMLEALPFERLAADGEMAAYQHQGFWSPMDNINDRAYLEKLWAVGNAKWKLWKE